MLRPGDIVWFHSTCGITTKAKRKDSHVVCYDVVASSGGMLQVIDDDRAERKYRIHYIGPHIDLSEIHEKIMEAYGIAASHGLKMEEDDDI